MNEVRTFEQARPVHRGMARRGLWALVGVVGLALAILGVAYASFFQPYAFHGLLVDPPTPASAFTLMNQDGQPVSLSDYRGKLVLVYFGYTNCPDACPTTLGAWKSAQAALGAEADQVRFVFISIDPKRDTPDRLKEYLDFFKAPFVGLTGSSQEIDDVAAAYLVFKYSNAPEYENPDHSHEHTDASDAPVAPNSPSYQVYHSSLTYVIDRTGKVVLAFPLDTPPQVITSDLQELLRRE